MFSPKVITTDSKCSFKLVCLHSNLRWLIGRTTFDVRRRKPHADLDGLLGASGALSRLLVLVVPPHLTEVTSYSQALSQGYGNDPTQARKRRALHARAPAFRPLYVRGS